MANLQTPSRQHIDYDNKTSEIIAAIIDGHYSWACALYLQSIGHEPTAYMPHRTYTRLVRKHYSCNRSM
jgi:hypothetical protein